MPIWNAERADRILSASRAFGGVAEGTAGAGTDEAAGCRRARLEAGLDSVLSGL
ncbi:MAG: hypothetical protein LBD51_07075 [Bifidobacteriaceae bacterium]|nr:hypothetical protein [Bifidobacteriaceae bacterium]